LKEKVEELEQHKEIEQFIKDFENIEYLTPGSEGYTTIRFNLDALVKSHAAVLS
jgi:hypothetical protein